ncbi:filamentous hemagglutinin N-terminal domain-containing protein [Microcoleus sp. FACHB-SPT15]|uniref:two-partner secretion domain-containing protein n=1 Tax=Microcoleus sp. FACHB-SPT15 TaxID=2692830 RepID=UPI00177C526D|nr:filamentous hemagglutinin N-terminal domain-containing protein [Microcoleus sp. FACHB-SPT15]MBD1805370.1 filamentous hemagglutinin N-terminal domain-containing protein [Microcoleus sp. FACHB-SPT15]
MTRFGNHGVWSLSLASVMAVIGVITGKTDPTLAQIVPDQTLGTEPSQVMPNVDVRGGLADRIDGGAVRGVNLFHSFGEFNVRDLQRVYFANPEGIENILGRVTGSNRSDIFGTLGVDGGANLFLINPNGIVFGPNAQLDIRGSFVAGTADRFKFPDGSEFRATNPNAPPLVTVNIPIGLQYGSEPPAALVSEADLAVGRDLALSGGSVTSTGHLSAPEGLVVVEGVAGDVQVQDVTAQSATLYSSQVLSLEESQLRTTGDLNLLADQTVRVRDSVQNPFLALSGGNLLVQGTDSVDILALNHPQTPFQSRGSLTLVSDGNVSGDAHFYSGGGFSILNLAGEPGTFVSLYDPIISVNGDVTFGNYEGVSLKVEATGSITAGNITITGPDTSLVQNTPLRTIGNATATLSLPDASTGVSNINTAFISNASGSIVDSELQTLLGLNNTLDNLGNGNATEGSAIQATFSTTTANQPISFQWRFVTSESTPSVSFNDFAFISLSGTTTGTPPTPVTLIALNELADTTFSGGFSSPSSISGFNAETGLQAFSTVIQNPGTYSLNIGVVDVGDTGVTSGIEVLNSSGINLSGDPDIPILRQSPAVILRAGVASLANNPPLNPPSALTAGGTTFSTTTPSSSLGDIVVGSIDTSKSPTGVAGPVILEATGNITTANIQTSSVNRSGNISIDAGQAVTINTANINSTSNGTGDAGNIAITGATVSLNNTVVRADAFGSGNAGSVSISAADTGTVSLDRSTVSTSVGRESTGRGSDIRITGRTVFLTNGATLEARTRGRGVTGSNQGEAGDILIEARDLVEISGFNPTTGIFSRVSTSSDEPNSGTGGDITVNVRDGNGLLRVSNGAFLDATTRSNFSGGNINVDVNTLELVNGGQFLTTTFGNGPSGNITITASGQVTIAGIAPELDEIASPFDTLPTNTTTLEFLDRPLFTPGANSDIESAESIPHYTVPGEGNGRFAYYSFDVASASLGIFDIDYGSGNINNPATPDVDESVGSMDTELFLFDYAGNLLATSDDATISLGEGGSTSGLDSYLRYNFSAPGRYVIGVGEFNSFASSGSLISGDTPDGINNGTTPETPADTYSLQVSLEDAGTPPSSPVQVPNSGLFAQTEGTGEGGDIIVNAASISMDEGVINAGTSFANSNSNVDTELFLFNSAGNLLASNDDSSTSVGAGGSTSSLDSYIDHTFTTDGTFVIGVGQFNSFVNGGLIEGQPLSPSASYTLQVSIQNQGNEGSGIFVEAEPNNPISIATLVNEAQLLPSEEFSLEANSRIAESTLIPHLSIGGTGDVTFDYYSFTTTAGSRGIFDIDVGGAGAAGDITLNALGGTISTVNSVISNQVEGTPVDPDDTAEIRMTASSIALRENTRVNASTTGTGDAGNVFIEANNGAVLVDNSRISTEVQNGAEGDGGDITITARQVTVQNQAQISAEVQDGAEGDGGDIAITAGQVTVQEQSRISAETLGTDPNIRQVGGNITLQDLDALRVLNGSQISASTIIGQAGSISVNENQAAATSIEIIGESRLAAQASEPGGNAGSVTINARQLTAREQAAISASNISGESRDIILQGLETLSLNNSVIEASTQTGRAGSIEVNADEAAATSVALTDSSLGVEAEEADGDAGSITINTQQLTSDRSTISAENISGNSEGIILRGLETLSLSNSGIGASTQTGLAGSIDVNAGEAAATSVELTDSSLAVTAEADGGNAARVLLNTRQLTSNRSTISAENISGVSDGIILQGLETLTLNNSDITASTQTGLAGSIDVNADEAAATSVELTDSSLAVTAKADGGNAARVLLNTRQLTSDRSTISAENISGVSDGIILRGLETLSLNNSEIEASTLTGLAGNISLNENQAAAESVFVSDNSELSVEATGSNADSESGLITINTRELTVEDDSTISAATNAGQGRGVQLQNLERLSVNNSLISSSTISGVAGDVIIDASDSVTLSGTFTPSPGSEPQGGVVAAATAGGRAGSVTINTGDLLIRDEAEVSVSSPSGIAGNVNVNADFIGLNQGSITAEAGQGEGGANIDLNASGFLRLDNESLISALATGSATGGNININAQYVIASFPKGSEGSDIVADAVLGNGGQITINALGIFGLDFRPARTPLNDITASSQGGAAGTVQITTLGIDPSRGLAALPLNFIDVSGLVGGQCSASGADGELSQFTIIGRGGLPLNPTDPLAPEAEASDWVTFDPESDRISPQAHTPIRITPFTSSVSPQQLAQFPSLCYQSWSTSAIAP